MKKSISIIKEKKAEEKRVILTPKQISLFINAGFNVYVEEGAGDGIGIKDKAYPRTTVDAMSQHLAPYILQMCESFFSGRTDYTSDSGRIVDNGKITHYEVSRHMEHWKFA